MEDQIPINHRFLRSVNLVSDRRSSRGLTGYVVTPSVRKALARMAEAFGVEETERAFTLTGPYGTGKSSFALFFSYLLTGRKNEAWILLEKVDPELAKVFRSALWDKNPNSKGYLALTVTARRTSVSELLAECFDSLEDTLLTPPLLRLVDQLRHSRDTKTSLRLTMESVKLLCTYGYKGVFFIFDEFGKIFEQARYAGKETDVFLLQELAEAASRSGSTPVFLLGILHQSFADYASPETTLRKEFSKIEGRFDPISFVEPIAAQIQLTAAAFPDDGKHRITREANGIIRQAKKIKLPSLTGLTDEAFQAYATRAFPLHPLTLVAALPLLFRRIGQNERSIFSFLTSNEPNALQDFARRKDKETLLRLCDFYDYFVENFEVQLGRHPYGHAFLEAEDVLRSKPNLSNTDQELIKTIAVLTSLGKQSPILATEELIKFAMSPNGFLDCLQAMCSQSILVYRKFNKTYALWSGSDIDLAECYKEADEELGKTGFSIAETLQKFLPPLPVVAKRHSIEKGTLRFFETHYADTPSDLGFTVKKGEATTAAGKIIVCLPRQESENDTFVAEAEELSRTNGATVFAIPGNITELSEALMEVRRLNWIEENVRGLRDDRIARREVAIRKAEANQGVTQYQYGLLDPRPAPDGGACVYVHNGEVCHLRTNRDISVLLSGICDTLYPESPVILNELINKRNPSSQAASARRIIINSLNNPEQIAQARFGIDGCPPERSIYESVLAASGMHRKTDAAWVLSAPSPTAPTHLLPAWKRMEELVFEKRDEPLVLRNLYAELTQPPYGVLDGLLPILIAAFYALNRDEVSLYSENTFLPEPQNSNFELMVRRPELFAISGMRITGNRQRIVERLAKGLQTESKVLAVVRRLYAMMNTLTKYARETNAIPEHVQAFRQVFFDAKSPEKLLFLDLPNVFGLDEISEDQQNCHAFDAYFKTLNECTSILGTAFPNLIAENRKLLLEACGFENTVGGWQALYDKASFLLARMGGTDIVPFLQNIVNTAGDWSKADQVMSYIQQTPMDKWGPLQIDEFRKNVKGISERFKAACKPFDYIPASLTKKEQEKADSIVRKLAHTFTVEKSKPAILRAALLAYLEELDKKENAR